MFILISCLYKQVSLKLTTLINLYPKKKSWKKLLTIKVKKSEQPNDINIDLNNTKIVIFIHVQSTKKYLIQ